MQDANSPPVCPQGPPPPAHVPALQTQIKGLTSGYEIEHLTRIFFPGTPVRKTPSTTGALIYARAGRRRLVVGLRLDGKVQLRFAPLPVSIPGKGFSKITDQADTDCKDANIKISVMSQNAENKKTGDIKGSAQGGQGKTENTEKIDRVKEAEKETVFALSQLLYGLLRDATGWQPPWGMLTGVRPVRLLRKLSETLGPEAARDKLVGGYGVSEEKVALIQAVSRRQMPLLAANTPRSFSLYISIPFCPSRCAYCSFVSRTIERDAHLVAPYLDKLAEELQATAVLAKASGLTLETIYIGGGTPTALSAPQLQQLLCAVETYFDTGAVREYTVEAGRPDCTTPEKLTLLKTHGVSRVSINPQTLSDAVLANIGRRHTAQDILRCFADARAAGHHNINMDIIAGLPGDTLSGFADTLSGVLSLAPENITLHTLTLKRASDYVVEKRTGASSPGRMLQDAYPRLATAGYLPYYLYRQKSTVENLENTGWAKPGAEGWYNVFIMEETHTILAVGAGASTKMVAENGRQIRRIYNPKFPADYLMQFEQVLTQKRGVTQFYASYLDPETSC